MIKIGLCMQTMPKYVFRHSDFHKTQKCSLAACVHLPYWIQSKSIKKYGEYGSKLIYDRKKSVTTVARIITRFTLRQRVVRKPYSEINSNPIHGLWIIHFILWMIFLTLSSKVYNYYYSSSIGATTLGGFWPAFCKDYLWQNLRHGLPYKYPIWFTNSCHDWYLVDIMLFV